MEPRPIPLAIVGCGTVVERFHAPALRGFPRFSVEVLVDRDPKRTAVLARSFEQAARETDFTVLGSRVEAAIVALPNHLNAPVSKHLLDLGISVLVEKPVALTPADALTLEVASQGAAKAAVGLIRREAAGVRMAKAAIDSGMLGDIQHVSIEDGYGFGWEAVAEFRFDATRGGGILFDIGSHCLDMLCFWLGDIAITRYADDAHGGVDTNGHIEAVSAKGVPCSIELSWTRTLRNTARIVGSRATLEIEWYRNTARLVTADGRSILSGSIATDRALRAGAEQFPHMFLAQLQRWHASLTGDIANATGLADARAGVRNIELIAACRATREPIAQPWRNAGEIAQ